VKAAERGGCLCRRALHGLQGPGIKILCVQSRLSSFLPAGLPWLPWAGGSDSASLAPLGPPLTARPIEMFDLPALECRDADLARRGSGTGHRSSPSRGQPAEGGMLDKESNHADE
jgi:hypothetical protein